MIEVLTNNHYETILDLFDSTNSGIKIVSPFISKSIAEKLCDIVKNAPGIKCAFVTRFYLEDFINKANSLSAIEMMLDAGIEVYAIKGLHTKLYLFDSLDAVLGSANFTVGGFISNVELSLHIQDEADLLSNLHNYFDSLLEKVKTSDEGKVTKELLVQAKEKYQHLFKSKKGTGETYSTFMYGAVVDNKKKLTDINDIRKELDSCKSETDVVHGMFKEAEKRKLISLGNNVWMKFAGEGNDRIFGSFEMTKVLLEEKQTYLSCYPRKPGSIKEDDEIYMAALTIDKKGKSQPVIVGRGKLKAFSSENYVKDKWILKYHWMDGYPWYCVIKELRVIDTDVVNGVPLDNVLEELRSDTYVSSFGREESVAEVTKKHFQKAHIRLTGNAKQFIDKELDRLENKFGSKIFKSEE